MMNHVITVGDVLCAIGIVSTFIVLFFAVAIFGYSQFWWGHR